MPLLQEQSAVVVKMYVWRKRILSHHDDMRQSHTDTSSAQVSEISALIQRKMCHNGIRKLKRNRLYHAPEPAASSNLT